jgi:hypothetical protein
MIAGKTLEDLGYEVLYPGDDEMPPLTLFILKWTDRVNTTISYYKRYDGEDKLERFIKYVSTSLKQSKIYKY